MVEIVYLLEKIGFPVVLALKNHTGIFKIPIITRKPVSDIQAY
jgi:hypothetical protein